MRIVLIALFCTSLNAACYRLENKTVKEEQHGMVLVRQAGTATAISKHQLLTACHNVVEEFETRHVEVGDKWYPYKIVAMDKEHDLALLETEADLDPYELDDEKFEVIGSLEGKKIATRPATVRGITLETTEMGHGLSGGACLRDGKLAGIVVQGYVVTPGQRDDKMLPNKCDVVGVVVIKEFLAKVLK
jgi:hypothetical protein